MKEERWNGIVLRYANFSESSRMLTLFTPQGLVPVTAKGCRRMKSPLRSGCELFVFGEYLCSSRGDSHTLRSVQPVETFFALRENLDALNAACAMRDMVLALVTEQDAQPELFALMARSLGELCRENADAMKVQLHFEMRALSLNGYEPVLDHCAGCGGKLEKKVGFSPAMGGALCEACAGEGEVSPASVTQLRYLRDFTLEQLRRFALPEKAREPLMSLWRSYREYYLERHASRGDFVRRAESFLQENQPEFTPKS